jgi:hypothetical protein
VDVLWVTSTLASRRLVERLMVWERGVLVEDLRDRTQ